MIQKFMLWILGISLLVANAQSKQSSNTLVGQTLSNAIKKQIELTANTQIEKLKDAFPNLQYTPIECQGMLQIECKIAKIKFEFIAFQNILIKINGFASSQIHITYSQDMVLDTKEVSGNLEEIKEILKLFTPASINGKLNITHKSNEAYTMDLQWKFKVQHLILDFNAQTNHKTLNLAKLANQNLLLYLLDMDISNNDELDIQQLVFKLQGINHFDKALFNAIKHTNHNMTHQEFENTINALSFQAEVALKDEPQLRKIVMGFAEFLMGKRKVLEIFVNKKNPKTHYYINQNNIEEFFGVFTKLYDFDMK